MESVLVLDEINLNNLSYLSPIKNSDHTIIHTEYNGKPLIFQLPSLYTKDGFIAVNSPHVSHELLLPIMSKTDKQTQQTRDFFTQLDEKIVQDIQGNSASWLTDVNQIRYRASIHNVESEDPLYQHGCIKVKLFKRDNFTTTVYDRSRNELPLEQYKNFNAGYVKCILELVGIWIKNSTIGLYIRPHQIRLSTEPRSIHQLSGYMFRDDSEGSNLPIDTDLPPVHIEEKYDFNLAGDLPEALSSSSE